MNVVNYGHNDLDQLGCMLNIHYGLPGANITFFHTNYRNITEVSHEAKEYIHKHDIQLLLITDVSFAQHRDLLEMFSEMTTNGLKIIYIDHHIYPDNFFDGLNMKVHHDITKAATLLTHEFFGNQNKSHNLDILTNTINIYDLWKVKEPNFKHSMELNEYFWEVGIEWLYNEITSSNYNLPGNYAQMVQQHNLDAKSNIEKYHNKNLIHSDGTTTIAFVDKFFNEILFDEFEKGIKFMIISNSYGVIRVRTSQFSDITDTVKNKIKYDILGASDIGHLNAYALKVKEVSFNHIMEEIKRISGIINKHI